MTTELIVLGQTTQPASQQVVDIGWSELLHVYWDNGLAIRVGPWLLVVIAAVVVYLIWRLCACWRTHSRRYDVVEAELQIANLGKVKVRPSHEDAQIAYKAWVELVTRKAAIPFDPEHDTIVEVYNSWLELFRRLRELIKSIPAHRLRKDKNTRELVRTLIAVLNDGLRPHLTCWQARFRRWYSTEIQAHPGEAPQSVQKRYEHYQAMLKDLQAVNKGMVQYANWLHHITVGTSDAKSR